MKLSKRAPEGLRPLLVKGSKAKSLSAMRGVSPDARFADGASVLEVAASANKPLLVCALTAGLKADARDGKALLIAAERGYDRVAWFLLAHNAPAQARGPGRCTALHLAAQGGHAGVANLLVKHGAVVDASDAARRTPLLACVEAASPGSKGHEEVASLLLGFGAKPDKARKLAEARGLEALTRLLAGRSGEAQVDAPEAVKVAIERGDLPALRRFLETYSANASMTSAMGRSLLQEAVRLRKPKVVALLLERGANPNGGLPLEPPLWHVCGPAEPERLEIARMLLEAGANPAPAPGGDPMSFLETAARFGNAELARLLLARGADPNDLGRFAASPLWYIACAPEGETEPFLETARVLLEGGADPRAGAVGRTPLEQAQAHGRPKLAALLSQPRGATRRR